MEGGSGLPTSIPAAIEKFGTRPGVVGNEWYELRPINYEEYEKIPVQNFRQDGNGIFSCSAGKDRLALSQDGMIWGCYLFSDYFKDKKDLLYKVLEEHFQLFQEKIHSIR